MLQHQQQQMVLQQQMINPLAQQMLANPALVSINYIGSM
jgi:hypothetical protein